MTSLQITYFLKVADCMSFSQAAEELYVSQPSVSRQIQLLEKELGHLLFDRSRKNAISLTAAGMVFRDNFRRSLRSFEAAKAAARAVSDSDSLRLRIGIGQGWDLSDALISVQEQLRLRYPKVGLYFESNTFLSLHSQLQSGQMDVILCTRTSLQSFENLEIVQLGNLESRVYVRRGLLRQEDEPLQVTDFHGHRLLMLPEEEAPMSLQIIMLQFMAHQVKPRPVRLPNRGTIYQALLRGEGFTVFDEYMELGRDPRLTYYRLDDQIPICIVWDRRNQNPLIRLFAEAMTQELDGNSKRSHGQPLLCPDTL